MMAMAALAKPRHVVGSVMRRTLQGVVVDRREVVQCLPTMQ